MKSFDFNKLVDLEIDVMSEGHSSSNKLEEAVDLLYWIDERKEYLPLQSLIERGYVSTETQDYDVFSMLSNSIPLSGATLFKSGNLEETVKRETVVALWQAAVIHKAEKIIAPPFEPKNLDFDYLAYIASLSVDSSNIRLISDILLKSGIIFIVEPSFSGLGKDGCLYKNQTGNPVIAISLRFDRLDNFWFTLLHELAHIVLHYEKLDGIILEDMEEDSGDETEDEANYLARECIVERSLWKKFSLYKNKSKEKLIELASLTNRHPALLAGRARFESKDWSLFSEVINSESPKKVLGL